VTPAVTETVVGVNATITFGVPVPLKPITAVPFVGEFVLMVS
jgi:cellobiose-specific phosphotransferase system component IIC